MAMACSGGSKSLVADNAKKLGGLTGPQVAAVGAKAGAALSAQVPGPASTAAGLLTVKQAPFNVSANNGASFTVTCDSGQKATGGGWVTASGGAIALDNGPTPDGSGWTVFLGDLSGSGSSGNLYALCIK